MQNIKYLESAVNELMTGALIRSDMQLNPVKKRRSFGSRMGIKPQKLRVKTKGSRKATESVLEMDFCRK